MHDPDFDGDFPPKAKFDPVVEPEQHSKSPGLDLGALANLMPISRLSQAVFAESFRQGIIEGLAVDHAARLAAEVNPDGRFQRALRQMAINIRSGYPVAEALARTGVRVRQGLLSALRVGEEHGFFDDALASFARRTGLISTRKFHRAIGRSPHAVEFAAALARLLERERLTVRAVRAAGQIAANGDTRVVQIMETVARAVEDGGSLPWALQKHPDHFDILFRGFLAEKESRDEIRACLGRLGARA